jgi:UDP-sulfoquinovose synthase
LPNFHYDDIFGTVVNRFLVQAVAGIPLTIYGKGGQQRGYLNLKDTLQCVELALNNPVGKGELRILNQFTEQLSVNDIAEKIYQVGNAMGLKVTKEHIANPRKEKEEHYYNAKHHGLMELGLQPHYFTDEVVQSMLEEITKYQASINKEIILPRVSW